MKGRTAGCQICSSGWFVAIDRGTYRKGTCIQDENDATGNSMLSGADIDKPPDAA